MPCFEPTIAEACSELSAILAGAVFGDIEIDEPRLTPTMQKLLALFRQARDGGADREALTRLDCSQPDSDTLMEASMRKFFDGLIDHFRVCCVTTKWDNEAMWAHYAEGRAGCVLGFRHIPSLDTPLQMAEPIEYTTERPVVGTGLDWMLYGDTPDLREKTRRAVCLAKKAEWSGESEWRVFIARPNEEGALYKDLKFYPDELESVTLGSDATPGTAASVRLCLKSAYSRCTLYQFVTKHGETTRVQV